MEVTLFLFVRSILFCWSTTYTFLNPKSIQIRHKKSSVWIQMPWYLTPYIPKSLSQNVLAYIWIGHWENPRKSDPYPWPRLQQRLRFFQRLKLFGDAARDGRHGRWTSVDLGSDLQRKHRLKPWFVHVSTLKLWGVQWISVSYSTSSRTCQNGDEEGTNGIKCLMRKNHGQIYFTISWELQMRYKHVGTNIVKAVLQTATKSQMQSHQYSIV